MNQNIHTYYILAQNMERATKEITFRKHFESKIEAEIRRAVMNPELKEFEYENMEIFEVTVQKV